MTDTKFIVSSSLFVGAGDFCPNEVTADLELQPTSVQVRGQARPVPVGATGTAPKSKRNVWAYSLDFLPDETVAHHLERYAGLVKPRRDRFVASKTKFGMISLIVRISERGMWPAVKLSPKVMKVFAAAEIQIELDIMY